MKRLRWNLFVLLAPTMALAVVLAAGCGDKKGSDNKASGDGGGGTAEGGGKGGGGEKKPIEAKTRGTLKGQAMFVGNPPDMASANADILAKMKAKDEPHCVTGASEAEKTAFEWRIDPKTKAVENVIVWLAPTEGTYFKLSDADKKPARMEVVIDQPHCAFIPHCEVAFTHYMEGTKPVPTGQKVIFKNSAPMAHNTNYKGLLVTGANNLLNPNQTVTADIKPDRKEITVSCEVHPWMRGYIRALDHPWAAVTDKDGNFEIKNVPAGVEVNLVAWHEKAGMLLGSTGKKVTFKEGDNTEKIDVSAK